jgi:hypothetical protein
MPRQLSLRTTVVVVSLLFSVCFALQVLGRPSSPNAAVRATASPLVERPGAAPKVALSAATRVPALRDPRKPKPKPKPKRKRKRHKVVAAPRPAPVRMVATPTPTPTPAATRAPAPAPRYVPPARTPAPTPKATPPPSGSFDTSGAE